MRRLKISAGLLALVLVLSLLAAPVSAAVQTSAPLPAGTYEPAQPQDIHVPKGYNLNDYTALYNFWETKDANGVKNGEKISETYDPEDPETWVTGDVIIFWTEVDGEQRIEQLYAENLGLVGELDLSNCTSLRKVYCSQGQLTKLNVSGCTKLVLLDCKENQLTSLDLTGCRILSDLKCSYNQLETLDVSGSTQLYSLWCDDNKLTSLNLNGLSMLINVSCMRNELTSLDVSQQRNLFALYVSFNHLTTLDVSMKSNLNLLQCFNNELTSLNVSNSNVNTLWTHNNKLTSLDTSSCLNLQSVYCYGNPVADLKLGPKVTTLKCAGCPLNSLATSVVSQLYTLDCSNTGLTELELSGVTNMLDLNCSNNQIKELDLSTVTNLTGLDCSGNQIAELDISQNNGLNTLNVSNNPLKAIDTSAHKVLWALDIHGTEITELDLSVNTEIVNLSTDAVFKNLDCSICRSFPADQIVANGNGRIGVTTVDTDDLYKGTYWHLYQISATAVPDEGEEFEGWYEDIGLTKLISTDKTIYIQSVDNTGKVTTRENKEYYAKFSGAAVCTHENTELRDAKEATCTEDGYTGDTYCKDCGTLVKEGEAISALGHDWDEWTITEAATCTKPGVETRTCKHNCGETETREIPATGHGKTEIRNAKAATCTETGYTGDEVCTICGETVKQGEIIPALGHEEELRGAKDPTETEDGYTGDTYCKRCGKLLKQGEVIPATGCPSAAFTDLNTNAWYHAYTDYVIAHGFMKGMDTTHFAPEKDLTRGQMVTTLYRLAGEPEVTEPATFTDVAMGRYYTNAIAWAEDLGIAKGMTDTTFAPEGTVTRQQAATFLYRYVTECLEQEPAEGADLKDFRDGDSVMNYAKTAMCWAVAEGFFEGYGDGTLRPAATLTRAQMAKLLTILDQNF